MSFPHLPALARSVRSVRSLHTSRPAFAGMNAGDILGAAFAGSAAPRAPQPPSSLGAGSTHEAAASMIGTLPRPKTAAEESVAPFSPNHIITPFSLTEKALHPAQRPGARHPLLGPPRKVAVRVDPFHITKTSPMDHDMNPYFAYQFVNSVGRIKSRADTGLTWKSQRRAGKLIRRARAMGLISQWTNRAPHGGLASYGMNW
ncbi:ribosomal protein S18 [Cryptococcus sp. DSM 104549]